MGWFGGPDVRALAARGDVRGLIRALRHRDTSVRRTAADALGTVGDPGAVEALAAAAVGDPEWTVRHSAVSAMRSVGDARAVPALVQALSDPMSSVAQAAAFALADMGDERAIEPLLDQPGSVSSAVRLLIRLRDPRGVDLLVQGRGIDFMPPDAAAAMLRDVDDPRVVPWLIGTLSDEDIAVRVSSARVVGLLEVPEAVDPLADALAALGRAPAKLAREADTARLDVVRALHAIVSGLEKAGSVDALTGLLEARTSWIRPYAASVLERMGHPGVVERLAEELGEDAEQVRGQGRVVASSVERLAQPKASMGHLIQNDRRQRDMAWDRLDRLGATGRRPR